jgi:streptomycin 6-kinase
VKLQARLAHFIKQWSIVVEETRETPTSGLAFGRRDRVPVVLKVSRHLGDEWHAGRVLQAFGGRGMVRAHEAAEGAVLLERLIPGTPLAALSLEGKDDDAIAILGSLVIQLNATQIPAQCPTVHDWGLGFSRYLSSSDNQIPRGLVERAQARYLRLAHTQGTTRLLHGDLQHYNVLHDAHRGWVAIDPKGVIGEREYELGASLRNPAERLVDFTSPATVERRLTRLSGGPLEMTRVLAWGYAQAVLSALWMIEDGLAVPADDPTVRLALTIEPMLPPA